MAIPNHVMSLYEKPAAGNSWLGNWKTSNYRHKISALGGFDSASCDIAIRSKEEGQKYLRQFLGNRVAFFADNPVTPIWEGFINRMTFAYGGLQYTISLDQMANRVRAIYTNTDQTVTTQATALNSTASQAIYGIKQEQVDMGIMLGGGGVTTLLNTILAQRAFPKTSSTPGSGPAGVLHINFLGFYHTLTWEDNRNVVSSNVQLGNLIDTVIGGSVNNTTFFDNTDLTGTIANTATLNQYTAKGESAWDVLMKVAEIGNASQYFVIGIGPTRTRTNTRAFYYRAAASDIVYTARAADGLRIRNLYGKLFDPWRVTADAGIRVQDQLIAWNRTGDNPNETYIMTIEYDANTQKVVYRGDDDLSAEGVFNLKRFNKAAGKRLGAVRRLA